MVMSSLMKGLFTWNGNEHDLLVLELLGGIVGDRDTADPGDGIVSF